MKVIFNSILFVYSLRGAIIKIARGCHTRWRNYFDGTGCQTRWHNYFDLTTPLLERVRRYLRRL